ncbi:MAG: antitoxin VapB family protein [Candidatus Kariarchaeaceae archaeon]|jgi:predicted CopG family antitoxin
MVTKTLSISEAAYLELKRLKKSNESFSDLILRLIEKRGDPSTVLNTVKLIRKLDEDGVEDLAANIEITYQERVNRKIRDVNL